MSDFVRTVANQVASRARKRSTRTFTTDDIHAVLDLKNYPRTPNRRHSLVQRVLNDSRFTTTGFTRPSARPTAKNRQVSVWRV